MKRSKTERKIEVDAASHRAQASFAESFPIRPHTETLVRYILGRLDTAAEQALILSMTRDADSRKRLIEAWRVIKELAADPAEADLQTSVEQSIAAYWRKWSGPYALPRWEAPFVGRDGELEQLKKLLGEKTGQAVTVVGASGMGKTRLACEIAMKVAEDFSDGVLYLSCREDGSPADLLASLSCALGGEADADLTAVQQTLAQARTLILLDGCEKIEGAGELLRDLLHHAPGCRWLLSSVEPLGLSNETLVELGADADHESCVQMFISKLKRIYSDLALSQSDQARLHQLCHRLNAVPLKIVLAVALLSPGLSRASVMDTLEKGVETSLKAEKEGGRAVASLDAFKPEYRQILLQLRAFSGPFTAEDAEAVVALPKDALARLLEELVGLELLGDSFDGVRHRYEVGDGIAKLIDQAQKSPADEAAIQSARDRHAEHFLQTAERIGAGFKEGSWQAASSLLHEARLNLRTAVQRLHAQGRHEAVAKLSNALSHAYFESGFLTDFRELANAAKDAAERLGDKPLQASLLGLQGALASRESNDSLARELWKQRLEICREIGDVEKSADTLIDLAWLAYENEGMNAANACLNEAVELVSRASLTELNATVCVIRARMLIDSGKVEEGLEWVDRTNELIARSKNQDPLLFVYQNLVRAYQHSQQPDKAAKVLNTLLKTAISGDRAVHIGWALRELSPIFEARGELDKAERCLVQAIVAYRGYQSRHAKRAQLLLEEFAQRHGRDVEGANDRWSTAPLEPIS